MSRTSRSKRTGGPSPRRRKNASVSERGARPKVKAALPATRRQMPQMWSAEVTRTSNALDLEPNVFTKSSPAAIARSLKRSAEQSRRRKAEPYRSAMSMLTFYINRAGKNLPEARLQVLQRAKGELRKAFGRA